MIEWRPDTNRDLAPNERSWLGTMTNENDPPIPLEAAANLGPDNILLTFGFQDMDFTFPTRVLPTDYAVVLLSEHYAGVLNYAFFEAIRKHRSMSAGERRARRLLSTFLSPAQSKMLTCCRYFHERGRQSGEWYRFVWNSQAVKPVFEWGPGRLREVEAYYCLHPAIDLLIPIGDVILGQLLLLRSDERAFIKRANFHVTGRGARAAIARDRHAFRRLATPMNT